MGKRPLSLVEIPEAMLAEYGLKPGSASSYRYDDPTAKPVWISDVLAPQNRGLNEEAVRSLLSGVRDHAALPPVVVVAEGVAKQVTLLDGLHRYQVSVALGFRSIPCIQVSLDEAVDVYGYGRRADS
jgi:ParB-like nuclease family protein